MLFSSILQPKTLAAIAAAELLTTNVLSQMFTHTALDVLETVETVILSSSLANAALFVCRQISFTFELH